MVQKFANRCQNLSNRAAHYISQTVPLARTMAEQIQGLRTWADGRARDASIARLPRSNGEARDVVREA